MTIPERSTRAYPEIVYSVLSGWNNGTINWKNEETYNELYESLMQEQ